MSKKRIIRITTVPLSLGGLLKGQLNYMSEHFEVIGISSYAEGFLDEVGKDEHIGVIPVEMTRKITPIRDLMAVWQLYRHFRKLRPHIVHSHTPKAGTVGMLAAYLARVPHRLHTIAGLPLLEAQGTKRKLLDLVEKITYSCATKIYPNSFGLADIIKKNGYTRPEKLKVLANGSSNGIDTAHFDPEKFTPENRLNLKKELGIAPDDYVFVFVGRLVKDKGINELVAAFDRLNAENKTIKLLLIGSYERDLDPLSQNTEQLIRENENIIAPGWQTDVRPYFAVSNALAFPSYREGFPNVVMQAGAMGLPSIVTDINGCNEIISHGHNGTIIPKKDGDALYEAMKNILTEKHTVSLDNDGIREAIVSKYDRRIIWEALRKEYERLG